MQAARARERRDLGDRSGEAEGQIQGVDRLGDQDAAAIAGQRAAARDVDGRSVLENSMIVYAGGNADPNRHTHTDLPVILAGAAGGRIETGRFHKVSNQPMCNLFLDMLDRFGVEGVERLGDSTGRKVLG